MNIKRFEVYNVKIPFIRTIKHNLFTRNETESIVVVAYDSMGNIGTGEGTPRSYVTGELLIESLQTIEIIAQEITQTSFESIADILTLTEQHTWASITKSYPAAFCAIELALLDLWAKWEGKPIYMLFDDDANGDTITYSGVIPYVYSEPELIQYIELVKKLKLKALKVKITDMKTGLSQLEKIRENIGSGIDLRVDINAAFSADMAMEFIRNAQSFKLSAIEQPVAKEDLSGLKKVSANSNIPIIADESMYTYHGPEYLIDNDVCHGLNLRISSCGGLHNAHQLYLKAIQKKMVLVLGSHVGETAILSYAGRHLAMMCPGARYIEGSFSKYVLQEDLVHGDVSFGLGGKAPVPKRPGLCSSIDKSTLLKWSELHASISG